MTDQSPSPVADGVDPVPPGALPTFLPLSDPTPPTMPEVWRAVALLHPFSPPPSGTKPDSPFFQLCLANIYYRAGVGMSIQVSGCDYGSWWYIIRPTGTELSTDQGRTWTTIEIGWQVPTSWFGTPSQTPTGVGASPLNWMSSEPVEWWKSAVSVPNEPPAATWMWFDAETRAPIRMMFGYGPPTPDMGDPTALAFFQMFSFTYLPVFELAVPDEIADWAEPAIPGFYVGNPKGLTDFEWNTNFGMTAFMTPVNEKYNPLPTRVLYVWKDDADYRVASDRSQHTKMDYTYNPDNPGGLAEQIALLTGRPPAGVSPPPDSDEGFYISYYAPDPPDPTPPPSCVGGSQFPFPQEPPDWVSIPAVEATIRATIIDNDVLGPGQVIAIYSVLFPPAPPNYPEATYLWTWYSPMDATGLSSRPITFMQSQSGVSTGTSLALADYYYYEDFATPIDPANFAVPSFCSVHTRKHGLRPGLP